MSYMNVPFYNLIFFAMPIDANRLSTINFYGSTFLVVQNPLLNQVGRIFPLVNMWSHCLTLITLAVLKSCLGKYGIHSTDGTILKK